MSLLPSFFSEKEWKNLNLAHKCQIRHLLGCRLQELAAPGLFFLRPENSTDCFFVLFHPLCFHHIFKKQNSDFMTELIKLFKNE